jgi:hypothetical protein
MKRTSALLRLPYFVSTIIFSIHIFIKVKRCRWLISCLKISFTIPFVTIGVAIGIGIGIGIGIDPENRFFSVSMPIPTPTPN